MIKGGRTEGFLPRYVPSNGSHRRLGVDSPKIASRASDSPESYLRRTWPMPSTALRSYTPRSKLELLCDSQSSSHMQTLSVPLDESHKKACFLCARTSRTPFHVFTITQHRALLEPPYLRTSLFAATSKAPLDEHNMTSAHISHRCQLRCRPIITRLAALSSTHTCTSIFR